MWGSFVTLSLGVFALGAFAIPSSVMAREADSSESVNCADPKHRHVLVRPLTEPVVIRKADKFRIRRVLM